MSSSNYVIGQLQYLFTLSSCSVTVKQNQPNSLFGDFVLLSSIYIIILLAQSEPK